MCDILIKFPSRARPKLFAETFEKWDRGDVRFVVSLDVDDETLPEYLAFLEGRPRTRVVVGKSRNKVEAINRDLLGEEFDVLILASDDFVPQRNDYAAYLSEQLLRRFPDGDGVVQVPDGRRSDGLNTVPIVGRAYYERDWYIYRGLPNTNLADGYASLFCDDEFTAVSKKRGRVVVLDEVVLKHEWIGDHAPDGLHQKNESYFGADCEVFKAREAVGFPA